MIARLKRKFSDELTEEEERIRQETLGLMKQMLMKNGNDLDFITNETPKLEEKNSTKETRKGMDFILEED